MANISTIITILIAISGIIAIYGRFSASVSIQNVFRPLSVLLIILLGLLGGEPFQSYNVFVLLGLIFVFIGDLLMLFLKHKPAYAEGALGFAIVLFTLVCAQSPGPYFLWGAFIPAIIIALAFVFIIMRKLKKHFFLPIILTILLSVFVMQAAGRAWYIAENGTEMMFAGAISLAFSAAIFLFAQDGKQGRLAAVFYLTFYWSALTLIALSTW